MGRRLTAGGALGSVSCSVVWIPSKPWRTLLDAMRSRAERAHSSFYEAEPERPGGLAERRAWCGAASLSGPSRDVAFARSIGLTGIDIIINDHSAQRSPMRFTVRDRAKIETLASMAGDVGLDVHLMSWVMPHRDYIAGAVDEVPGLMEATGAKSIVWDAEEPWTLAASPMDYYTAGASLTGSLRGLGFEQGVTGIRYASTAKLGGLVHGSDYIVPQCYSTRTSKADPSTVVAKGLATWRAKFGDRQRFVAGLAAYRQTGIAGHSIASAIGAAADGAAEVSDAAIYWSLSSIRASPQTAEAIRRLVPARVS